MTDLVDPMTCRHPGWAADEELAEKHLMRCVACGEIWPDGEYEPEPEPLWSRGFDYSGIRDAVWMPERGDCA